MRMSKAEVAAGLVTLGGVVAIVVDSDLLPYPWNKILTLVGAVALYLSRSPILGGGK